MSYFPVSGEYKTPLSGNFFLKLQKTGFQKNISLIVKREKDQYIYDIDNNKYIDFFLNNGSVIMGHNYKTITQSIKDGISAGITSFFVNKFDAKIIRLFKNIIEFDHIAFFNDLNNALYSVINRFNPKNIGVNTSFLKNQLLKSFPKINIETAGIDRKYDLLICEPIDFENNLSPFPFENYKADTTCSFESRTAFRLQFGFLKNLDKVDLILSSNNIANGMDCAVILSKYKIEGENIPSYKALTIYDTVNVFHRKINYEEFIIKSKSKIFKYKNKSIFKLNKILDKRKLLSYGILFNGDAGFISFLHSEFDIRRLVMACEANLI